MSSMRLLVHEPIKTLSILMLSTGTLGCRPMYSSARSMALRLFWSFSFSGSGTRSSMLITISGDVPQVTCGRTSSARSSTTWSNLAPASECSVRQ
ncbi:hypothetical protein D3C81_1887400 [compost metagenome]